jgi:Tannase and feruloyl esterase
LDGATDGIIAAPSLCNFDPGAVVDQTFDCFKTGEQVAVSSETPTIALATWSWPRTVDGKFLWYGLNKDAPLAVLVNSTDGCNGTCFELPYPVKAAWISQFVQKDPNFNLSNISPRQYDSIFRQSINQYESIIGTNYPDLTDFRDVGRKMITCHGLADDILSPNGTCYYYQRVLDVDPNAADYYRVFPALGVGHCVGGVGCYPSSSLQSLVDWVENDIVPEILEGTTLPDVKGTVRQALLCPYISTRLIVKMEKKYIIQNVTLRKKNDPIL